MDAEILQLIKDVCRNTLIETLEIEFVKAELDEVVARMPVSSKVHQPDGVLVSSWHIFQTRKSSKLTVQQVFLVLPRNVNLTRNTP